MTQFRTITILFTLTISLCSFGQKNQLQVSILEDNRFLIDSNDYKVKTAVDTLYYHDKTIQAIGNVALEKDSSKSKLKVGLWTEYYSNGQNKSQGTYQIDSYIQCCTIGHCRQYRNYKTGLWKYYYDNGQIKATGKYKVTKEKTKTSCKGGDKILTSHIDNSWEYFNNKGDKIKQIDNIKLELENAN